MSTSIYVPPSLHRFKKMKGFGIEVAIALSNVKKTRNGYYISLQRRWPSGRVLAYRAQGREFNPWPSHT